MKNKVLVTIVTRNNEILLRHLIDSINKKDAGYPYDIVILDAESDDKRHLNYIDQLSKKYDVQTVIDDRVETSYNVSWKKNKDYEYYFFFHDDCCIQSENWLKIFINRMNSGYYEKDIEETNFKYMPIGKVSIGNQFWRNFTSVRGFPIQCMYLKPVLEILYPNKVPEMFKMTDCDRVLIRNECMLQTDGFRNIKEFSDLKKQNKEMFDEICKILENYLTYYDEGAYPKEIYPPGQYWSKLTLVTEYLDSIDPLIRGWRGVGLYDDGYLEQLHGFDVPMQHKYITHYGAPNYRQFISKIFNSNVETIRGHFKNEIFLNKCDNILKQYLKKNG